MYLNDLGIVCALGGNKSEVLETWLSGRHAEPKPVDWLSTPIPALEVSTPLPAIPKPLHHYNCRNNQMLLAALEQIEPAVRQAINQFSSSRIGLVIGASTSGIAEGEQAMMAFYATGQLPSAYHYKQQELGGGAEFLANYLRIGGPAYTVSTSCSSSANAMMSARRLLRTGVCDAVLVGGGDALCHTTLEGFAALGALSPTTCNPFSHNRDGTLIGEGAALFLMSREPSPFALLGIGASSDAYHISAPRPDGCGAYTAMQAALNDAKLTADQVDYINLHGTATLQNDAMESLAVAKLFDSQVACSSSKPATGHCLGAAGAIEAALCWLLLSDFNQGKRLPLHLWDGRAASDLPELGFITLENPGPHSLQYCLSNSFSFGGNNASLLIGHP